MDLPDAMIHRENGIEALVQRAPIGPDLDRHLHLDAVWAARHFRAWRIPLTDAVDIGGCAAGMTDDDPQRDVPRLRSRGDLAAAGWPAQRRRELAGGASEHAIEIEPALECQLPNGGIVERTPQLRAITTDGDRAELWDLRKRPRCQRRRTVRRRRPVHNGTNTAPTPAKGSGMRACWMMSGSDSERTRQRTLATGAKNSSKAGGQHRPLAVVASSSRARGGR